MFKKILKTLLIGLVAMVPIVVGAQINFNPSFSLSSELGVEIIPTYPRPNDTVVINLTLYTDDLNSANITWYQDNKEVLSGRGETQYSFKTGAAGKEIGIEIFVELASGSSFSKNFKVNPAQIDLVWEANSYVPPFYKGKALHSRQGTLKIVAMSDFVKNGQTISSKNLIYEWSNGNTAYQNQSGYGKNVLLLNGSILGREDRVNVLVRDPNNSIAAQGSIVVFPTDPEIIFYENNPYYGHLFERAVGENFELSGEEVQISATPFYFSKESLDQLKYNWRLNGSALQNLSTSRTIVFRKPEEESGRSSISLSVENLSKVLQMGDNSFVIEFEPARQSRSGGD